ncbi:MAG: hypothetical protein ACOY45_10515 [Pseudomonadota bacterium]
MTGRWERALHVRSGYWFAPKLFGLGATPVTWQGWLSLAVYVALFYGLLHLTHDTLVRIATMGPLTLAYLWLVWTKTDGGWRWRWGPGRD